MVSEKTMFKYIDGTPIWAAWLKGQPWPLELVFSHGHIRLNIPSENNDIGFSSFKKINFSKIPHFNALGSKFDLGVK